jgi:hypothetical protein
MEPEGPLPDGMEPEGPLPDGMEKTSEKMVRAVEKKKSFLLSSFQSLLSLELWNYSSLKFFFKREQKSFFYATATATSSL